MKIGLIAMSGVRACDTELLQLGLTLPGFVECSNQIASPPSLGLLTLAGMTPREHTATYHEAPDAPATDARPMNFDLVAISSLSAQVKEAYGLAERYHALRIRVVMCELHVTSADKPARLSQRRARRGRTRAAVDPERCGARPVAACIRYSRPGLQPRRCAHTRV